MTPNSTRGTLGWVFNYANNPLTLFGITLATLSGITMVVFLLSELAGGMQNPYIGIFAYMIVPAVLFAALLIIPVGMWRRRNSLITQGVSDAERAKFPRLDFNDPRLRRIGTVFILWTAGNGVLFGLTSYLAVHELESVEFCGEACHLMQPELIAYRESPHSRVECVQCHIGPGASWFVRSKLDGLRQVVKTAADTYPRPIPSPIHNLRPARETCEQCHWPEKHYGDSLRVFARFDDDEENTAAWSGMVMKTGGGRRDLGEFGGIHWWHIFSDNRIRYVAGDDRLQEILWVELTTADGDVRTYTRDGEEIPPPEVLEATSHTMDCIDCHNRPTHLIRNPVLSLDSRLAADPGLRSLPFYKKQAVEAINSEDGGDRLHAIESVRQRMVAFYQENYPDVWAERQAEVERGADVAGQIYGSSNFPEMNLTWETHPNNIGHELFPGCWRCHDEEMSTPDGEHVISMDCEMCHVFLFEDEAERPDLAYMGG